MVFLLMHAWRAQVGGKSFWKGTAAKSSVRRNLYLSSAATLWPWWSLIPSPHCRSVWPLVSEKRKQGGRASPTESGGSLRAILLMRAYTRFDCKLPDHFKYFKMISAYFWYCLPSLYIVITSHLPFVKLNPSKHPALGTHFTFCSAPIPPQTYMSRNKELRHDILMFLSWDSLLPREGREPKSRRRKASEKEWLRSSCGNSYSVYVPPSSRINPAGLPTQSRRRLFICMSCL